MYENGTVDAERAADRELRRDLHQVEEERHGRRRDQHAAIGPECSEVGLDEAADPVVGGKEECARASGASIQPTSSALPNATVTQNISANSGARMR